MKAREALEQAYSSVATRAGAILATGQVSPTEVRRLFNAYYAVLEESRPIPELYIRFQSDFEGIATRLRIKTREQGLEHFQDFRTLMGVLNYDSETGLRGNEARLIAKPIERLPVGSTSPKPPEYSGFFIEPKVLAKVRHLEGKYVSSSQICTIAGYHPTTLYRRIDGSNIPKKGRKYLLNKETIPVIFGRKIRGIGNEPAEADTIDAKVSSGTGRSQNAQDIWMAMPAIMRDFGYKTKNEVHHVFLLHPELKKRGERRGKQYLITEGIRLALENRGVDTAATSVGKGNPTGIVQQDRVGVSSAIPNRQTRVNGEYGDVLSFEEMVSFAGQVGGDNGQLRLIGLLERHNDLIQIGENKFNKAKLEELLTGAGAE